MVEWNSRQLLENKNSQKKDFDCAANDTARDLHSLIIINTFPSFQSNCLNSSQVDWKYDDSPKRPAEERQSKGTESSSQSQTPVRIFKRHVSSPSLSNPVKPGDFSRFQLQLEARKLSMLKEDLGSACSQSLNSETQLSLPTAMETDQSDFFDDAILNSIPLDVLSQQSSSSIVELVYNHQENSSEILKPKKPLPRHSSGPLISSFATSRPQNDTAHKPREPLTKLKSFQGSNSTRNINCIDV